MYLCTLVQQDTIEIFICKTSVTDCVHEGTFISDWVKYLLH